MDKKYNFFKGVKCLLIPKEWAFNICDPDINIPYDEYNETGIIVGMMMATIFNLNGFPEESEKVYEKLEKILIEDKPVPLDKNKVMCSIGITSEDELNNALNRAAKWSLITITERNKKLFCKLNKEAVNQDHWDKIKKESLKKLSKHNKKINGVEE